MLGTPSTYNHIAHPKMSASCCPVRKRRHARLNKWWCTNRVILHIKPASRLRFLGTTASFNANHCWV